MLFSDIFTFTIQKVINSREMNCPCYSCSQYRKWVKIGFFKKTKTCGTENDKLALSRYVNENVQLIYTLL